MKITIIKCPPYYTNHTMTGIWCDNPNCKENPEFFIEREEYHGDNRLPIKEGAIVARLDFNMGAIQNRVVHYCYDCIDVFLQEVKQVMDKKLWVFH